MNKLSAYIIAIILATFLAPMNRAMAASESVWLGRIHELIASCTGYKASDIKELTFIGAYRVRDNWEEGRFKMRAKNNLSEARITGAVRFTEDGGFYDNMIYIIETNALFKRDWTKCN